MQLYKARMLKRSRVLWTSRIICNRIVFLVFLTVLLGCEKSSVSNNHLNEAKSFHSKRASDTLTTNIEWPIDEVFSLLGVYEERKWSSNWNPKPIFPPKEILEEHASFSTPGFTKGDSDIVWIISKYTPDKYLAEYLAFSQHGYWTKSIHCMRIEDSRTSVTISYSFTSLSTPGNANIELLNDRFEKNLKSWIGQLKDYLSDQPSI